MSLRIAVRRLWEFWTLTVGGDVLPDALAPGAAGRHFGGTPAPVHRLRLDGAAAGPAG